MSPLIRAALVAAVVACAGTALAVISGPVDAPKARGLHRRPTPTGGGVAILMGAGCGALTLALSEGLSGSLIGGLPLAGALGLAVLLGLLGAADDLLDLDARFKLIAQTVLALVFAAVFARVEQLSTPFGPLVLGPVGGTIGSALWIVVVVNAVNFMDGANGLSPGAMIIALAVLGAGCLTQGAPSLGDLAMVGAASGLGFLPWNLPAGRIFQGDVGALFSGALFATLLLVAAGPGGEAHVSLWFGPLALLPLLTDVFLTLIARARRREPLLKAHRDHLFQRWLSHTGASHAALSLRVWTLMALAGGAALALASTPVAARLPVFLVALLASVGLWLRIDRRIRR